MPPSIPTDAVLRNLQNHPPDEKRKALLNPLSEYLLEQIGQGHIPQLVFICTHNSRRSQLAQIWAQTAAAYYQVPATCFSGGVMVTEFNEHALGALVRSGFQIAPGVLPSTNKASTRNQPLTEPRQKQYRVRYSPDAEPMPMWSKTYDDPSIPQERFAAIMTCSDADENCPYIPGAEARFPVRYTDPKISDGTSAEAETYDRCSLQIATEMFYVFSRCRDAAPPARTSP